MLQETYEANALEKCNCLYNVIKEYDEKAICIADDSGISIDALNGFPCVHTARWMDEDDHTKNLELLKKMEDKLDRSCHYINSIAIVSKGIEEVCSYSLDGTVSLECKGSNGFGFDEIFIIENGKTLAEISSNEKYIINPRTNSLKMTKNIIENLK